MVEPENPFSWDGRTVKIVSRRSGYVLTAPDKTSGRQIVQSNDEEVQGLRLRRWKLTLIDKDNAYKIVNVDSGKVLEVLGASLDEGAAIVQFDDLTATQEDVSHQRWRLIHTTGGDQDTPAFYQIMNVKSDKAIDVNGSPTTGESLKDGAPIIQWTYIDASTEQWLICDVAEGIK
jgi:hypothetical protein